MLRIGGVLIAAIVSLSADRFALIVHPQSPIVTLTQSQARMIYLKKRRFWGETKLIALNLPAGNTLRHAFEYDVLKMNRTQLDRYWMEEHYKGYRPPYQLESVESVLIFVKKVKGAIGYIPIDKVDSGVKVVYEESK